MNRKMILPSIVLAIFFAASVIGGLALNISGHAHAVNPVSTVHSVIASQSSYPSFTVVNSTSYGSTGSSLYALNATTGALIWKYQPSGYTQEALLEVHNGVVYASFINWSPGPNMQVAALSATTGALLWLSSLTISGLIDSFQIVNGIICIHASQVGAGNGLFALKMSDGSLLWSYMVGDYVSKPIINQGVIYANSAWLEGEPHIQTCALSVSNGSQRWCYPDVIVAGVVQEVIYTDSDRGGVMALNASNGSLLWNNSGVGNFIAVQKFLYTFSNAPGTLCELNASDGSQLWCSPTLGPVRIGTGVDYTYSNDSTSNQNSTEAFRASDGTILWLKQNTNFISAYQGIVYAVDTSNNLEAIKGSAGTVLWQHNMGTTGIASNSPSINSILYYLGNDAHSLFALNATNGTLLWQHTFAGSPQLPTVVNSIAYVLASTTVNGKQVTSAYAFDASNGNLLWNY